MTLSDTDTVQNLSPIDKIAESLELLSEENIPLLCQLDRYGFLLGADEGLNDYKERLRSILNDKIEFKSKLEDNAEFNVCGRICIREQDRIPEELCAKAQSVVCSKYAIDPLFIDSFYSPKNFGLFIGGCAVTFDSGLSVILLRNSFRNKAKWLLYSSEELLAHELCHSARAPLKDNHLEEFFAYGISSSPLRRYLGNCFRNQYDALLLLAPIFLLMIITVLNAFSFSSINPLIFWILIFLYPGFLMVRNHLALKTHTKAKANLDEFLHNKQHSSPILFRCSYDDISSIAKLKDIKEFNGFLREKTESSLRWKVINYRFIENQT